MTLSLSRETVFLKKINSNATIAANGTEVPCYRMITKKGEEPMFDKIVDVMLEYNDVPRESITPDTRFLADLHMNSLDIMDMVGRMEEEFDVVIATEDLNDIFTVQDLADYLNNLV